MVLGSTLPRLWTKPLVTGPPGPCGCGCALTEATSYGFDVVWFAAEVLGAPLDPWERWAAIHGGELLVDGRPRFRKLLIIVARQQGKTHLVKVLTLYWQFVEYWPMILGTSTNLGYAKEVWASCVEIAESVPELAEEIDIVRKAAGEECLTTVKRDDDGRVIERSRYRIAASNRKGGRSLTIFRLVLDELREHQDWSAWGAAYNAMNAVREAQAVAITNMGDETSVVLDSLRSEALRFIEHGTGDERLGLLEWSAPEGSDPEDPAALAMSNPNLGRRTDLADLLADARRAKANGGEELTTFLTEILCIRVRQMNPAIDPAKWAACLDVGDLEAVRSRVALCVDVSLDGQHASLVAAAMLPAAELEGDVDVDEDQADAEPVERVRVEVVKAWSGPGCMRELRRDLPALVRKIKPRVIGWFPAGPAAAVAAQLAERKRSRVPWPPPGVKVEPIGQETAAVCMGFAEQVDAGAIAQSDDPMLNAHALGTEKHYRGDVWVFTRKDSAGPIDGAYAAAGAVHLARTLPPPPRLKVITSRRGRQPQNPGHPE